MTFTTSHAWAERRHLPEVPAIYGLHDGQGQLLYVGQTINLRQRLATHHRSSQMPADGVVRWLEVEPSLLDELERRLIAELAPPLNGTANEDARKPRQTWTLPQEDVELIRQLAALHMRTPSAEVGMAVRAWIKQHAAELKTST